MWSCVSWELLPRMSRAQQEMSVLPFTHIWDFFCFAGLVAGGRSGAPWLCAVFQKWCLGETLPNSQVPAPLPSNQESFQSRYFTRLWPEVLHLQVLVPGIGGQTGQGMSKLSRND